MDIFNYVAFVLGGVIVGLLIGSLVARSSVDGDYIPRTEFEEVTVRLGKLWEGLRNENQRLLEEAERASSDAEQARRAHTQFVADAQRLEKCLETSGTDLEGLNSRIRDLEERAGSLGALADVLVQLESPLLYLAGAAEGSRASRRLTSRFRRLRSWDGGDVNELIQAIRELGEEAGRGFGGAAADGATGTEN